MMKKQIVLFSFLAFLGFSQLLSAQGMLENYQRAEKLLPRKVNNLVYNAEVNPHWIGDSGNFWYKKEMPDGKQFLKVSPAKNTVKPAFDHKKLANALSEVMDTSMDANRLPFDNFEFVDGTGKMQFTVGNKKWTCDLKRYKLESTPVERRNRSELLSPDGKWVAFVKDYNLWIRSVETKEEIQLSSDGKKDDDYATPLPSIRQMVQQDTTDPEFRVAAQWSPDSKKILTFKIDQRKAGRYDWVQSVPKEGGRPKLYSSAYPLPGEKDLPKAEPVVFHLETKNPVWIKTEPVNMLYYGSPWRFQWTKDSERVIFVQFERGYKSAQLKISDASTGDTRDIIDERHGEHVHSWDFFMELVNDGEEIVWASQRDGWNHLYLFDGKTGTMKNQITKGEWVVREIKHIDEKERIIYFLAGGREEDRDPYLRHLYRVHFDGSGLALLTPEDADHEVRFSPGGKYFTDNFSRINSTPVTVLRSIENGQVIRELEKANLDKLLAMGWQWPEPFKVKARDGKTDIYGAIFRPSNFDASRKYPVIDFIYAGPHYVQTPKNFSPDTYTTWGSQAIAELGFIVVTIDGLGSAKRSKAFLDYSFKNLGDAGLPDHIKGIKELAEKYPYMDLSRVGIFGHSAGGYSSTHAILAYPGFFKVAVSSAGNHVLKLDKATWIEQYMGYPVGDYYDEQSNVALAHQLKGKLFLIHGDLDDNVHPASTLLLADALIKANKDFDLLIFPNRHHSMGYDPYFIRRRWDYFVKHLLGVDPPENYKINSED